MSAAGVLYSHVLSCRVISLGGLPLTRSFGNGKENIELSLRVWLCGGLVIRQPCARVAVEYPPVHSAIGIILLFDMF